MENVHRRENKPPAVVDNNDDNADKWRWISAGASSQGSSVVAQVTEQDSTNGAHHGERHLLRTRM